MPAVTLPVDGMGERNRRMVEREEHFLGSCLGSFGCPQGFLEES